MKRLMTMVLGLCLGLAAGCASDHQPTGKLIRTVEHPYTDAAYDAYTKQVFAKNYYWTGDPVLTARNEIYQIEGDDAVFLSESQHRPTKAEVTVESVTARHLYLTHMKQHSIRSLIYWVDRVEIYSLPEDLAKNPALQPPPKPD